MKRSIVVSLAAFLIVLPAAVLLGWINTHPAYTDIYKPVNLTDSSILANRRKLQLQSTGTFEVFHGFRFTDRYKESGITFVHKMVDDIGIAYKMVHYDHGNGMAVADVDNDGLTDIYFLNQVGPNELWRNLGNGRFENITETSGLGMDNVVSVGAAFADTDNDGDVDLFLTTVRADHHLFENDGKGVFKDVSDRSGFLFAGHGSGAVFFDYDRDGLLDLFLTHVGKYTTGHVAPIRGYTREDRIQGEYAYHVGYGDSTMGKFVQGRDEPNLLFRNTGNNAFVDVSVSMGVVGAGWSGDASPIDGNEDGWPDLYVLNMQGNDEYYENQQGKGFVLKTPEVFGLTPYGAMGIKVIDFNNDGRMDLYITDMHSDMWETNQLIGPFQEKEKPQSLLPTTGKNINGNALYINEGTGKYSDRSNITGAETYWPWGLSTGDLNADGWEDAFVTGGMNYPFRYGINSVLLNNRGKQFLDSEFILGVEPRRDYRMAKIWFEVDCGKEPRHRECVASQAKGPIAVWGALGSRSSAVFDLDNDGDLDIVTNDYDSEPMVLVSDLNERKPDLRFIKVQLRGGRSNRDGLGAIVRVYAGPNVYTRVHDGKSGYLSQSSFPLYFGLDRAASVDRIEVAWPSGHIQTLTGPFKANGLVQVVES